MSLKIISALWVAVDGEEQMTNPQDIKTTYLPPREGQCHLSFTPGHYIRSLNFLFHILAKFNSYQNMSQLHTWQFTIVFLELIYNKIEVYNNNLCYIKRYINKGDLTHNIHLRNTHQPDALCLSRHNKNRLYVCWSSTCTPYINTALKNKQCLFNFSPAFIESTSSHFLLREMLGVLIITAAQG